MRPYLLMVSFVVALGSLAEWHKLAILARTLERERHFGVVRHVMETAEAAQLYANDGNVPPDTARTISVSTLIADGYLPAGWSSTTALGGAMTIRSEPQYRGRPVVVVDLVVPAHDRKALAGAFSGADLGGGRISVQAEDGVTGARDDAPVSSNQGRVGTEPNSFGRQGENYD